MNKKKYVAVSMLVLIIIVTIMLAYWLQKNKEPVTERVSYKVTETDANKKTTAMSVTESSMDNDSNDTTEDYQDECGDNIMMIGRVKIELLSADVLEGRDISAEMKYPVENFKSKELPAENLSEEITDWDAVCEASPEFKKLQESSYGEYTNEEAAEINERASDLIDSCTTTVVRPQKVYFIKCRLTNEGTQTVTNTLPLEVTSVSDTGEMTFREDLKYYDKPIYTDGDERSMKYFFFRLAGNESMECTIGLVVPQEFGENDHHYYGDRPLTANGEPCQYDPAALPNYVDIDALPKPEE